MASTLLDGAEFNDAYIHVYNDIQRNNYPDFLNYIKGRPNLPPNPPQDLRAALKNPNWKPEVVNWSQTRTIKNGVAFLAEVLKYQEKSDQTELIRIRKTYLDSGWVNVPRNLWP